MNFKFSPELNKELKKIKKRDIILINKIEKQLLLFQKNPVHPSLRTHKLTGKLDNIWSISIDKNIRMLYIQDNDSAYFFDVGTHDEVYKK